MPDVNDDQDRALRNSRRAMIGLVVLALFGGLGLVLVTWLRGH